MILHHNDFYESGEAGLQIGIITGIQAAILNFSGIGKLSTSEKYASQIVNGEILSTQKSHKPPFNNPTTAFSNSTEIKNCIALIK